MSQTPECLRFIAPVFRVSDISRALGYYRDQLGFAVDFVSESFYAAVSRDGCRIHLPSSNNTMLGCRAVDPEFRSATTSHRLLTVRGATPYALMNRSVDVSCRQTNFF